MTNLFSNELGRIKKEGLYRHMQRVEGPQCPEMMIGGRNFLVFAGNNYLGLANHPEIKRRAIETIGRYGTGSGASRLITGSMAVHEEFESRIASFKSGERALLFNTGYMANLGLISSLVGPKDVIFSDRLNHASIIDGARLSQAEVVVYKHLDMADLEEKLSLADGKTGFIVSDGVFSMDGDIAPLGNLVKLRDRFNCLLMIDDAHGTGVLGKTGRGTSEHFDIHTGIDVNMGTVSKALGVEGGFAVGSSELVEFLINVARPFIFSTSMSPGSVGAAIAALDVLEKETWRVELLQENSQYFRKGLQGIGLNVPNGITPIIPVLIGTNCDTLAFSEVLKTLGIFSPAIRPPTVPEGSGRIRVTIMAAHTHRQMDAALDAFERAGKEIGII
jgi:8-amino-7-oxononanoate synthase